MTNREFLEILVRHSKEYVGNGVIESVKRNNHINSYDGEKISKDTAYTIVVDFINFIALEHGIDLAMYTSDLNS